MPIHRGRQSRACANNRTLGLTLSEKLILNYFLVLPLPWQVWALQTQNNQTIPWSNLLATMIFDGVDSVDHKHMPDCPLPVESAAIIRERLNEIPHFKTAGELTAALEAPAAPAQEMLRWICGKFGHDIVPATGSLKIPGVPASVHQFIVAKHVPESQAHFDVRMTRSNFQSSLFFHGTEMRFLLPILRQGLKVSPAGLLWMADEPEVSYGYALGAFSDPQWTNHLKRCGVLLACEAAGIKAAPVVSTTIARAVIVRYILLIQENPDLDPNILALWDRKDPAPKRALIEEDMVAAFKKIQAGDIGSGS